MTVLDTAAANETLRHRVEKLKRLGVAVHTGSAAETHGGIYRLAVISPGIDPSVPLVQNLLRRRVEMIGELELAYAVCHCPVLAITGTNGKTTTTELVAKMIEACGKRTLASGNIGLPFAEAVRESHSLDYMTLEVSSFQLEQIRRFRAHVALWLNFSADHLDRYRSIEEYRAAKLRIFENQTPDDWAVVNLADSLPVLKAKKITFSAYKSGGDFCLQDDFIVYQGRSLLKFSNCGLSGLHNAENLMAAFGVAVALGLDLNVAAQSLSSYTAQPHRCENVREHNGVLWLNDSKATNLDAMEKALLSQSRPVVLIAGGKNKGFPFEELRELVASKARAVVLIGEMAPSIANAWGSQIPCHPADHMPHAVQLAAELALEGDVVLLSPGTSSFDMFSSYADRGEQFRKAVQQLT